MVVVINFAIFSVLAASASSDTNIRVDCPVGWSFNQESSQCLYLGSGQVSYQDAYKVCDGMNAELLNFNNDTEWETVVLPLFDTGYSMGAYGLWQYSQYPFGISPECRAIKADVNGFFPQTLDDDSFITNSCSYTDDMIFICERYAGLMDCFGSSCYYLMYDGRGCFDDIIHPARIESKEENQLVKTFLKDAPQAAKDLNYSVSSYDNKVAFISGSDSGKEGTWLLDNGVEMTFFDWKTSEPNNGNTKRRGVGEDCIEVRLGKFSRWNDLSCNNKKDTVYLCEMDLVLD